MQAHFEFGAIDTENDQYTHPTKATKDKKYKCPECKEDVVLKQGVIRRHHFSHKSGTKCSFYNHPEESEIHKNGKFILKNLLEQHKHITFYRYCYGCQTKIEKKAPTLEDQCKIILEYSFLYEKKQCKADIGQISKESEIECIYEIYHSHKTSESARPEPWFEVSATYLSYLYNQNQLDSDHITLPCIRIVSCDKCKENWEKEKEREKTKVKDKDKDIDNTIQLFITDSLKDHIKNIIELGFEKYEWSKNYIEKGLQDFYINRRFLQEFGRKWCDVMIEFFKTKHRNNLNLNKEQRECIYHTFDQQHKLFCQGEAGTGKSAVINCISTIANLLNYRIHLIAPTGMTASNLTYPKDKDMKKDINQLQSRGKTIAKFLMELKKGKKLTSTDLLVIDEISMVKDVTLTKILSLIGGYNQVLYFGDFSQFPPIHKCRCKPECPFDNCKQRRYCIDSIKWDINCYIELKINNRQSKDKSFAECLGSIRKGKKLDDKQKNLLNSRITDEKSVPEDVQHIFDFNTYRNSYNEKQLELLVQADGNKKYVSIPTITFKHTYKSEKKQKIIEENTLSVCKGLRVFVTKNINERIVNGTKGEINNIYTSNNEITSIEIKLDDEPNYLIEKITKRVETEDKDDEAEEERNEDDEEIGNKKDYLYEITQFPLISQYACSIYKLQGRTEPIILHLPKPGYRKGSFYVACSRAEYSEQLHIITDKIDFESIYPSDEQIDLVNGYIFSCKSCGDLIHYNHNENQGTIHFCDLHSKVPYHRDFKEYSGLDILDFVNEHSNTENYFNFLEVIEKIEKNKWKEFLKGLKNISIFFQETAFKKCKDCDNYCEERYDVCQSCYYKNKKCEKCNSECERWQTFCKSCYINTTTKNSKDKKCEKCPNKCEGWQKLCKSCYGKNI
jgi:hypothetical protein